MRYCLRGRPRPCFTCLSLTIRPSHRCCSKTTARLTAGWVARRNGARRGILMADGIQMQALTAGRIQTMSPPWRAQWLGRAPFTGRPTRHVHAAARFIARVELSVGRHRRREAKTTAAFAAILRRRIALDRPARREKRQLSLLRRRPRGSLTVAVPLARRSRAYVNVAPLADTTAGNVGCVSHMVLASISFILDGQAGPVMLGLDNIFSLTLPGVKSPETVGLVVILLLCDSFACRGERCPRCSVG